VSRLFLSQDRRSSRSRRAAREERIREELEEHSTGKLRTMCKRKVSEVAAPLYDALMMRRARHLLATAPQ
jgi:hypothetical protein